MQSFGCVLACVALLMCQICGFREIFKMRRGGVYSLLIRLFTSVRLHFWSSRVSPVCKSVCVTLCLSLLVIVNLSVVFFSMCPNVRPAAAGRALLGLACVIVLFSFYVYTAGFESLGPACGCWLVMHWVVFSICNLFYRLDLQMGLPVVIHLIFRFKINN